LNLSYGKADVTVAAKLLVPTESVYEWETKQNQAFGIKPLGESAPIGIFRCRFGLTKPLVIAGQEEKGANAERDQSQLHGLIPHATYYRKPIIPESFPSTQRSQKGLANAARFNA
jgi:hypothetical protein